MTSEPDAVASAAAERPLVAAIDIGSSSVRGAIYDAVGRPLAGTSVAVAYAWDLGPGGAVRLEEARLHSLVDEVLDGIDAAAAGFGDDIVAGGIAGLLHSLVGLDADGRAITPILSWADTTSAGEAASLRERLDATAVHATTGAPIHAGYWPAKIERLRCETPGVARWSGLAELVAGRLTGRAVVSRSMASGTGLLDRALGTWSVALLEALALDPGQLPVIVADDEPIGRLAGPATGRWPNLRGVEWFAPWGDGGCGNIGVAAAGPDMAAIMLGTSGALRAVVADPAPAVPIGLFAQRLLDGAVVGGQLSEGGATLTATSVLLRRSRSSLERAAAEIEPDGHGLTVLPYAFGERGLGYHDDARGAIVGITGATEGAAIYRAVLESIAYSFVGVDERLAAVVNHAPSIVASGGVVAHSPLFAQILADALGRDISVALAVESSRRGAALLALHGTGHLADPTAVPGPPVRGVSSHPDASARYQAGRARRDALYAAILG